MCKTLIGSFPTTIGLKYDPFAAPRPMVFYLTDLIEAVQKGRHPVLDPGSPTVMMVRRYRFAFKR